MRWERGDLLLRGPDDFVRLDALCGDLVRGFFVWLQSNEGGALSPQEASPLAHDADRYLRDFVVDIQETGPADPDSGLPRQYLANWYIVNTLTPSHEEIDRILSALRKLHDYLEREGVIDGACTRAVARALSDGAYFHRRLEDFWALTSADIQAWRRADDYRGRPGLQKPNGAGLQ